MQPKESKSSKHFYFSVAKSILRIFGCGCLIYGDFAGAGIILILAEILGIAEEF
jgi:hypothetical protein